MADMKKVYDDLITGMLQAGYWQHYYLPPQIFRLCNMPA